MTIFTGLVCGGVMFVWVFVFFVCIVSYLMILFFLDWDPEKIWMKKEELGKVIMLFVGAAVGTIKQTLSGDIKYRVGYVLMYVFIVWLKGRKICNIINEKRFFYKRRCSMLISH